jgi:formyltetrahydrofolate deformylase
MKNSAILLVNCPDQKGLTAAVADFVYQANGNILHWDEHLDADLKLFLIRVESRAVRWHIENRILPYGNKTVIFD